MPRKESDATREKTLQEFKKQEGNESSVEAQNPRKKKIEPFLIKWRWEQKEDTWTYLLVAIAHLLPGELREQC